jgi:hypothetical protein
MKRPTLIAAVVLVVALGIVLGTRIRRTAVDETIDAASQVSVGDY